MIVAFGPARHCKKWKFGKVSYIWPSTTLRLLLRVYQLLYSTASSKKPRIKQPRLSELPGKEKFTSRSYIKLVHSST